MSTDRKKLEKLCNLHDQFPISQLYGMKLSYNDKGEAVVDLPYNPSIIHSYGIGGSVGATLLDHAAFFAAAPHYSNTLTSIDLSIHFLEGLGHQHLEAIGRTVKIGKRICFVEMEVLSLEGKVLAIGRSALIQTATEFGF